MNISEYIELVNTFSVKKSQLKNINGSDQSSLLEKEKGVSFSPEAKIYIDNICPPTTLSFAGVGHPIELISYDQLAWNVLGFSVDANNQKIEGWKDNWLLIATDGGEPIFIDVNQGTENSTVYSAMKTGDVWDVAPIAESIGQFMFCACAIEHAMTFPGINEVMDEDFNLAPEVAQWLFPLLMDNAPQHYDEWASVFENYLG